MAQIFLFGLVGNDLEVKKSQKGSSYVCFSLKEQTRNGRTQTYQVWAWGDTVSHLIRLGVKKNRLVWVTGTLELVDCTMNQGTSKTRLLKVYLSNWGYVPFKRSLQESMPLYHDPEIFPAGSALFAEMLDGDRESLPE
uniref:single-stranded DNA-binding protein n=1 Tax=Enterocloster clostridioformis TaxID=1531 RepID=UPI0025A51042|nr:single-stranded DNA-binding protein [Enterocloster clostridioformis]